MACGNLKPPPLTAFNNDGTIECGTSCASYLFPFNDNDLSDDEKKMLIEAAYDYRFGSES